MRGGGSGHRRVDLTRPCGSDLSQGVIDVVLNRRDLRALRASSISRAATRAMRKASSTSLRDMRSEAAKRVRESKRIKAKAAKKALVPRKNRGRTIG